MRFWARAGLTITMAGAIALAAISSAAAQDAAAAEPPSYQPLIDGAVAEFSAGRWAEALALFRSAHELFPNARTLRGIGMSSFEIRDYPGATVALDAALADTRRPLTAEQRTQVSRLLERARAFVGRFVIPAAPEGARLYVDGVRADVGEPWPAGEGVLLLGVGAHDVTIRGGEGRTARASVVVRGREDGPLDIDVGPLEPPVSAPVSAEIAIRDPEPLADASAHVVPPPPEPSADPAPWIVVGVGGAVAVVGIVLLAVGVADVATVENAPRTAEWSEVSGANDRAPILTAAGGVLLGLGVATSVAGIAWGITVNEDGHRRDDRVAVRVGPGSISIGGSF